MIDVVKLVKWMWPVSVADSRSPVHRSHYRIKAHRSTYTPDGCSGSICQKQKIDINSIWCLPCYNFRCRHRNRNSMLCQASHWFCTSPNRETKSRDIYRFPAVHSPSIGCHVAVLPLRIENGKRERVNEIELMKSMMWNLIEFTRFGATRIAPSLYIQHTNT